MSFKHNHKCNVSQRHLQNTFILGALHPFHHLSPVYFNNAVIFYYKMGFCCFNSMSSAQHLCVCVCVHW